jgi:hypothetical protein
MQQQYKFFNIQLFIFFLWFPILTLVSTTLLTLVTSSKHTFHFGQVLLETISPTLSFPPHQNIFSSYLLKKSTSNINFFADIYILYSLAPPTNNEV